MQPVLVKREPTSLMPHLLHASQHFTFVVCRLLDSQTGFAALQGSLRGFQVWALRRRDAAFEKFDSSGIRISHSFPWPSIHVGLLTQHLLNDATLGLQLAHFHSTSKKHHLLR